MTVHVVEPLRHFQVAVAQGLVVAQDLAIVEIGHRSLVGRRIGVALLQHAVVVVETRFLARQLGAVAVLAAAAAPAQQVVLAARRQHAIDGDVFQVAVAGIAVALDRAIGGSGRQALACQIVADGGARRAIADHGGSELFIENNGSYLLKKIELYGLY